MIHFIAHHSQFFFLKKIIKPTIKNPIRPRIIQKPPGSLTKGIIGVFMPKMEATRLTGKSTTEIMVRIFIMSFKRKEIRDSLVPCKASMFSFRPSRMSQASADCSRLLARCRPISSGMKNFLSYKLRKNEFWAVDDVSFDQQDFFDHLFLVAGENDFFNVFYVQVDVVQHGEKIRLEFGENFGKQGHRIAV